jgi:hypothetical protein
MSLQPLKNAAGAELEWKSGGLLSREYALQCGGQVFATLTTGTPATAETAQESWTFERGGFLRPYVSARVAGTESEVARAALSLWVGSGILAIKGGREYEWENIWFWNGKWRFLDSTGKIAVRFEPCASFFKQDYSVVMEDCTHSDMPLLVTIGWYMVLLKERNR